MLVSPRELLFRHFFAVGWWPWQNHEQNLKNNDLRLIGPIFSNYYPIQRDSMSQEGNQGSHFLVQKKSQFGVMLPNVSLED